MLSSKSEIHDLADCHGPGVQLLVQLLVLLSPTIVLRKEIGNIQQAQRLRWKALNIKTRNMRHDAAFYIGGT